MASARHALREAIEQSSAPAAEAIVDAEVGLRVEYTWPSSNPTDVANHDVFQDLISAYGAVYASYHRTPRRVEFAGTDPATDEVVTWALKRQWIAEYMDDDITAEELLNRMRETTDGFGLPEF